MSVSETLPQVDTNTIVNGYTRLQSPEMRVAAPAASPGHMAPGSRSSSSTVSSLVDTELVWAESEEERLTVERIHQTKRQLQTEIDLIVRELTLVGQELKLETECQRIVQDYDETETKKHLRTGKKKFNKSPKEGIRYLVERGLLNNTAEDIAVFLMVGELLDKTAIGDYLGEFKDFNLKVLQNYISLYNFTGMDLVEALRVFLSGFRLPGEAQKIDRMMELFAHRYCTCNPGVFSNPDATYVLSFSIIMLNTSLHNPNVKESYKPTVERYISMNRGINEGKDLPADMLRKFYDCIKNEQLEVHDGADDLTQVFFNPDHEGWLVKEGGKHRTWKKRWFILSDNCLYYFQSAKDKEPRGIIPLENLEVTELTDTKRSNCFQISSKHDFARGAMIKAAKTMADGKVVTGNHEVYRIQAKSRDEMLEWVKRIRASIASNPLLERLQQRKQRVTNRGPIIM